MSSLPYKRTLALIFFTGFFLFPAENDVLRADDTLNEQQKEEQRQELNELALANAAFAAQQQYPAPEENPWAIGVVANEGYSRNVTYDSRRKPDTFHQETVTATYTRKHDKLLYLIPDGKYGLGGTIDQMIYRRHEESDHRNFQLNPFLTANLTKTTSLRSEYTHKKIGYIKNQAIGYLSHEFKATLAETRFTHWSHSLFTSVELKDYTKKFALDSVGGFTDNKYLDVLSEYGYSATYFPSEKLVFGVTGSYKVNDSNDNFKNTGDYDAYKVTGFIYAALNARTSWVGAAGYEHKWYRDKTITSDPTKLEWDGFLYFASYFYYNLSPKTQLVLSYLWDQNFSDDPLLQFNGSMATAGFSVKI